MKSHTDLSQSRTLAEFLPQKTADMHYNNVSIKGINYVDEHRAELMEYSKAIKVLAKYTINPLFEVVPCWSLAALFEQIPSDIKTKDGCNYTLEIEKCDAEHLPCGLNYHDSWGRGEDIITHYYDNFVDACVEMIIKLNEQKLL